MLKSKNVLWCWLVAEMLSLTSMGVTLVGHHDLRLASDNFAQQHQVDQLGQQIAAHINNRYQQVRSSPTIPAYQISGVLLHGWDKYATYKPTWRGKIHKGISFTYLRRDITQLRKMPVYINQEFNIHTNGIIFATQSQADQSPYQVLCAYPIDARSDQRIFAGCGPVVSKRSTVRADLYAILDHSVQHSIGLPALIYGDKMLKKNHMANFSMKSYHCAQLQIHSAADFYHSYNKNFRRFRHIYNHDMAMMNQQHFKDNAIMALSQCSFSARHDGFATMLAVANSYPSTFYGELWNEVVVKEWSHLTDQTQPVEALYYIDGQHNNNYQGIRQLLGKNNTSVLQQGRFAAKRWQQQILLESGRFVPIVRLNADAFLAKYHVPLVSYLPEDNRQ